jgi:hypothetical protein
MIADTVHFKGYRCFKLNWAGFNAVMPINVIIGRNNTGKSHLLDLVELICQEYLPSKIALRCSGVIALETLRRIFPEGNSGGILIGSHWSEHGKHFINAKIIWEVDPGGNVTIISCVPDFNENNPYNVIRQQAQAESIANERKEKIRLGLQNAKHRLSSTSFRRLLADRDIQPEKAETSLALNSNGSGATNIIRRFLSTSSGKYPEDVVRKDLLEALNQIFLTDGCFNRIDVKHHDEIPKIRYGDESVPTGDFWEIFLGEEKKGLIPLSNSGSGLKTVVLVLLNLLVIPVIEGKSRSKFTFAFEELENNLHPALFRRLLEYLESYAAKEAISIFLTTHSSAALDMLGMSKSAQIIRVTHDGNSASCRTVSAHFDKLDVVCELGAKPSDLLQANGIIWVEGPSDRLYINRWLALYTEGKLVEGRDYQCAFYGGALLARTQFAAPEDAEQELVNLLQINPNVLVICDSDQDKKSAPLKSRVVRIQSEIRQLRNGQVWVLGAREIENYLPGIVLSKAYKIDSLPDPGQYTAFFPRENDRQKSYLTSQLKRKTADKVELAKSCLPLLTKESMSARFDWNSQMGSVAELIKRWNGQ